MGSGVHTCLNDGKWSGSAPTCEPSELCLILVLIYECWGGGGGGGNAGTMHAVVRFYLTLAIIIHHHALVRHH